jgi:glycosyltransferase involved in cell wall biosynthesis
MRKQSGASNRAVFLSPEAPYPLAGGGPLRSGSLLHWLARRYQVHLITFTDGKVPNPEPDLPKGLADRFSCIELPRHGKGPASRFYRNTGRLIRGELPLTDRFGQAQSLQRVALATQDEHFDIAVIEHFWCAQYLGVLRSRAKKVVLDLHNIESVLHDGCARTEPWPSSLGHRLFRRTAERMEKDILAEFDLVLVTSEADRERVLRIAPKAEVGVYPNSIPLVAKPEVEEEDVVAFSGNLEYHPNVTAVKYFKKHVWPGLRESAPQLRWRIIGKNDFAIKDLIQDDPRIESTGRIDDAIQELARTKVVVVPLLAGSGTRIKILEAWAAERPVVSTSIGADGLPVRDGENIWIADDPQAMKAAVLELLKNKELRIKLGKTGRKTYAENYSWPAAWDTLEPLVQRFWTPENFPALSLG